MTPGDVRLMERAREDFATFVEVFWPTLEPGVPLEPGWHLSTICRALQDLAEGRIGPKLAICIPPRHGKSTIANALFPAWVHARNPGRRIMTATHTLQLSLAFGARHRDIVRSPLYHAAYPWVRIRPDSDLKSKWETTAGGFRFSGAVGSRITGHGGTLMIVDDPHDLADIDRPLEREKVAQWYRTAWLNRRDNAAAPEIVIMQRSAVDDLVGEISGLGFSVLAIPALKTADPPPSDIAYEDPREDGEALVEQRISAAELAVQRDSMGRHFHSIYQQDPRAASGALFRRDWFRPPPDGWEDRVEAWVRYWDKAATAASPGRDPDWTVGLLMGRLSGTPRRFVIADVARVRDTPLQTAALIDRMANVDAQAGRSVRVIEEQEPGSSGVESILTRRRHLREQGVAFRADRKTGPKEERWNALSVQAEAGNVFMLPAAWSEAFLSEAEVAPGGRHDDQLDAAGGALQFLNRRQRIAL